MAYVGVHTALSARTRTCLYFMARRRKQETEGIRRQRPAAPLISYRSGVERTLFVLALVGVLLTAHLAVWYGDNAAGVSDPVCGAAFDCEAVIANDPAPLGISSTVWGLLFYLAVAGACLGIAFVKAPFLLRKVRIVMVGGGFLYSLFLTAYQFFMLEDRCLLCLLSAATVASMAAILVWDWRYPRDASRPAREWTVFAAISGFCLVVLLLDWQFSAKAVDTATTVASVDETVDPRLCFYDENMPYFENLDQIVGPGDPVLGNPDGELTVIEFLDPNCNHCKFVHPTMKRLVDKYGDQVRFVFKPVTIVGGPTHSLDEAMALWLAAEAGTLEGMLDLQFDNQSPQTGISLDRLIDFADDLGMDEDQFRRDMIDRRLEPTVRQTMRVFDGMGLGGVPAILVSGRMVNSGSRSVGCIGHFIESELAAEPAP